MSENKCIYWKNKSQRRSNIQLLHETEHTSISWRHVPHWPNGIYLPTMPAPQKVTVQWAAAVRNVVGHRPITCTRFKIARCIGYNGTKTQNLQWQRMQRKFLYITKVQFHAPYTYTASVRIDGKFWIRQKMHLHLEIWNKTRCSDVTKFSICVTKYMLPCCRSSYVWYVKQQKYSYEQTK